MPGPLSRTSAPPRGSAGNPELHIAFLLGTKQDRRIRDIPPGKIGPDLMGAKRRLRLGRVENLPLEIIAHPSHVHHLRIWQALRSSIRVDEVRTNPVFR